MSTQTLERKELASAYLFGVLLAPAAAHRLYLGDWINALVMAGLWWGGWVAIATRSSGIVVVLGALAALGAFVWWVIDMCLMPSYVRAANASATPAPAASALTL